MRDTHGDLLPEKVERLGLQYEHLDGLVNANYRKDPGIGGCVWIGGVTGIIGIGFLGYGEDYGPNPFLSGACFMVVAICAVRALSIWSERRDLGKQRSALAKDINNYGYLPPINGRMHRLDYNAVNDLERYANLKDPF